MYIILYVIQLFRVLNLQALANIMQYMCSESPHSHSNVNTQP